MEVGGSSACDEPLDDDCDEPLDDDCDEPLDDDWVYDVELLPHDPRLRKNIMDYPPIERNPVRRAYILKKPCQPKTHVFPQKQVGGLCRFSVNWFKKWDWLEYSVKKDAAFCFACYLFKRDVEIYNGGDAFVNGGFKWWNKPDRFQKHVGGVKSAHNVAYEKYVNLRDAKKTSIEVVFDNASQAQMDSYHIRLNASLTCLRFLLGQGLAFRGHDESEESNSRGNFLELLKWLGEKVDEVKQHTFQNGPKNCQLTSPKIQKDIINCCAKEITKRIIEEIGDEQLALVLRFVKRESGSVVERFLGIVHVGDTTALSLKDAIRLVSTTKNVLQKMRDEGWDNLLKKVITFCTKHEIDVPSMDAHYVPQGRGRRFVQQATNLHHFRVEIFLEVIDLHLQELDNRFNEINMELLTCMVSLSPQGNFSSFDKEKILKLASLYPEEFSCNDLTALDLQLDVFLDAMLNDERFHDLKDINSLSMMLVETKRHETFPLIHLLIKLMLILPITTASVERVFSAMTYVKSKLRNSIGDQIMNDCLVTFIEKEVFLQFYGAVKRTNLEAQFLLHGLEHCKSCHSFSAALRHLKMLASRCKCSLEREPYDVRESPNWAGLASKSCALIWWLEQNVQKGMYLS
ncbi:uncharacterized protein LOC130815676 [Amaranthus tricolor]|uniref:uncharacterized protein LOC130815676 n=1 Tax=Amaranthus tricolor TaxID=29722 RepID=UPI002590EE8C|nr:uncharacterized protein LOC130815676 [Amaranthus tricolor]